MGYALGYDVAERLEANGIIVNYQATPEEESFTASGALRMGVEEMTRFGFTKDDFSKLAAIMADCILRKQDVTEEVKKLRAEHTVMQYCFSDEEFDETLGGLMGVLGV